MGEATFDPDAYKRTTREQWQSAAEAWDRWGPTLESWLGEATETMLDMAGVGRGSRVLDVAAGAGGQTLAAARRVGEDGLVLATDNASEILARAERAAALAGLGSVVATREMDGEQLDVEPGSFDAVITRLGLMYFPDKLGALRAQRAALREGGRVGAIVYSTADRNGFFAIPAALIRRRAGLPDPSPDQPGPFSLGAGGALEGLLEQAGFREVEVRRVSAPLRLQDAAECLRFERESFGALHQMLSGLGEPEREQVWSEVEEALARFDTAAGFAAPCELLVVAASR